MKILFKHVVVALVAMCLVVPKNLITSAAPLPFPDMEWSFFQYREAIHFLKNRRIVQGNPDGTFRPKDPVNRAEFLKMLFFDDHDIIDPDRRCFSDVNPDEWYAPYVCTAKLRTIVQGYPNGTFKPSQSMNFAEAIKMVMRVHGMSVTEQAGPTWYEPYAKELDAKGILSAHSFVPWERVTRERAADLLWRVLRYKENGYITRNSSGCTSGTHTDPVSVTVQGEARTFLLTKPANYSRTQPSPMIVAFHGRTNSNAQVRHYMRLDRELRDHFIVYPAGLQNAAGSYSWANTGDRAPELRGVALFDALVEEMAATYCIDMHRISVVGHSLGAWIANSVACIRGDVVLASATVGGDSVITECSGPSSALIAHSPQDRLAPFSGAERVRSMRMETNQCNWEQTTPGPAALNCTTYSTCAADTKILFCPHEKFSNSAGSPYYHTWPTGTATEIRMFLQSLK